MEKKTYTSTDIDLIILEHGWSPCICNNEPKFGTDTIQIAPEEDSEYFGQFVGNETDGYTFEFYTY